ncbi:SDR family oxidoreductase [Leptospira sarikeiensis]|uniref:SDR family oxidoreductase n=1 Tax=Leptospira sarikeiensis TaxID=2484943 RepID=A0A4R9K051_9LEPT|nr:SDR family oxidoreductase [Leptospira sarikeiensis]TGL59013.1 SDR family oxidoreductase [Leptospira sarikeiensis]
MSSISETVLVTGASGHLGKIVLEELIKKGHEKIIATTRNPDSLKDFVSKGVVVRKASFDDPASLVTAFQGADRILIISTDNIGSRIESHGNAIDAAIEAGAKRILYTSLTKADTIPVTFAFEHAGTEEKIKKSGLAYTILRNNLYSDYLIPKLQHAVSGGSIFGSGGEGASAYVTRLDCGKAAASALLSSESGNKILEISGPKSWTYTELAKFTSELVSKPISYTDISAADLSNALVGAGLPKPMADALASFDVSSKEGYLKEVSSAVKDLTGESPIDVTAYLKENKAALLG